MTRSFLKRTYSADSHTHASLPRHTTGRAFFADGDVLAVPLGRIVAASGHSCAVPAVFVRRLAIPTVTCRFVPVEECPYLCRATFFSKTGRTGNATGVWSFGNAVFNCGWNCLAMGGGQNKSPYSQAHFGSNAKIAQIFNSFRRQSVATTADGSTTAQSCVYCAVSKTLASHTSNERIGRWSSDAPRELITSSNGGHYSWSSSHAYETKGAFVGYF